MPTNRRRVVAGAAIAVGLALTGAAINPADAQTGCGQFSQAGCRSTTPPTAEPNTIRAAVLAMPEAILRTKIPHGEKVVDMTLWGSTPGPMFGETKGFCTGEADQVAPSWCPTGWPNPYQPNRSPMR